MSAIDVASPLRRAAERRAATQPYPRRRPRRSQRLGNPNDGDVNENENDDAERDGDALLDGAREETAAAARGGLFSRLFSFFPLGGSKKPVEPTKQVDALDASMASTSDHDDEKAELETSQESLEMVVEVAVKSPVKSPLAETAVSNGRTKPSRSPPSKRSSPARVRAAEKKQMSPLPVSSVFGHSSDKTKTLQIGSADAEKEPFAFQRVTGRRRNKPSSPRVTESPLAVIKKKKPISFEEYERLSTQLRNLVEATPENALALTRSTLSNALEPRGSGDAPASEVAGRDRRELSVAALPSVKRARPSEDLPITLPREDRLTRKPKPSRLLTGTKRDVASRSAYSAAVAEKILSTLNKIQTPLDKESQKPTPSTSLSWAKYQLALTKQESSTHGEDESMDADDQVAPPTVSVPKVAWKPAVVEVPPKTASVVSKTPTFSFPKPAANVEEPPAADVSASATASSTSKASVATAQTTIKSQYGSVSATGPTPHRQMGQFAFTLPQPASPSSKPTIDESVQYVFTPPPALREPPKRSPGQKALTAKSTSTTTPFSFMPSSPRVRPESLTKSVPRKENSPEKVAAPVSSASAAAPSSATNPLARFMQVDAGSWRCSTCAVMNAANLSKCPCCETAKPLSESSSAGSAISVAPASVPGTPAGANPLARFMQMEPGSWKCPSCAVTNGAKYAKCPCCDTNKPGSAPTGNVKPSEPSSSAPVSTASSGFTFGVSTVEPKKTEVVAPSTSGFKFGVESPKNASTSSSGFSFGVSAQSSSAPVPSSAPAPVSSGFTFGVAAPPKTASDSLKPTGGFTFGTTSTSASASADSKSISTKRKSSDEEVREGSSKKPAMPSSTVSPTQKTAEGFTFNVAASSAFGASASGFGTGDADKSKPTGGFTFGSTTTATGSVSKTPFTFGSSDGASATKVPEPSFVSSDQKTDVTPFKFGASDEKTATPSFTFGSSSAKPTEEKPGGPKPSFTFGATSAPSTETKPTDSKPSFTFGTPAVSEPKPASSSPPKVSFGFPPAEATGPTEKNAPFTFGAAATANSQSASTVVTKPAFEFGSSTPSVSFGASASTMSSSAATTASPAFAFGAASSDSIAKKVEAPAFTFGGSSTSGGAASAFSGDKPPTSAFGQAPAFGSTAPSSSGFGASSRSFSPIPSTTGFGAMTSTGFGSTTTPAASSSFGSAVSSGFGSSTSSGFGTSSGTFGSTSASTSFGSTPTTTPSFSTTPSSTPGAPAFAFGASTPATSQSGFGFGASTTSSAFTTPTSSAFGASSQTSGFGSAPAGGAFGSTASASGFGMNSSQPFGSTPTPSPAFGAAGNGSGFGGTAFGASAPVGGAFGVPTPTPVPAFGGSSSTFGAPSASFGAPGNAFGATPSPAAAAFRSSTPSPVFGAPATPSFGAPPTPSFGAPSAGFGSAPAFGGQQQPPTDGFNMGSAPPKRRILKAKSRPKRA